MFHYSVQPYHNWFVLTDMIYGEMPPPPGHNVVVNIEYTMYAMQKPTLYREGGGGIFEKSTN